MDIRSTFHLDVPMDLPWQLRPNRFPVLVDGSTRLQFGQSGFLPSIPWTAEARTSTSSVGTPSECNSVGTLCQSSHSPTHPIPLFPHQGAGGTFTWRIFVLKLQLQSSNNVRGQPSSRVRAGPRSSQQLLPHRRQPPQQKPETRQDR